MSQGDGETNEFEKGLEFATCFVSKTIALPFALRAIVVLGVPDIMEEAGPDANLTAAEIASRISTPTADSETLERLLRVLASQEVLTEVLSASPKDPNVVERRFGTTSVMRCLRSRFAVRFLLLLATSPPLMASMQHVHAPVLNPMSPEPFCLANGKGFFQFIETDSELQKWCNIAMGESSNMLVPKVLEVYRGLEGLSSLVDVGGGVGASLAHILPKYPQLRGINFDQPHVVAKGVQVPRLEHVGGDFFESVPEGDAVWMKWVMHDWGDEDCVKILKNVYRALPADGKAINIDVLLPEVSDSSPASQGWLASDFLMMTYCHGGKERTLRQFQKIAADAGFSRVEAAANVGSFTVLEFLKS